MNPAHLLRPLLESPAAPRLAWTLVHFLWQGAAAAAALTVLLAVLRKATPAARYAAACAVMALMVVTPVVTFIALGAGAPAPAGAGSRAAHPRPIAFVADAVPDDAAPDDAADATSRGLQRYVVLPWLAGVLALSAWRVGGWVLLRRMVRTKTRPVCATVQAAADALCRRLGVRAAVRLVESTWVQVPSVLGLLRPVVLLPASVLTDLSPAQLEAILGHELAHVRRRDYAVNLLQAAAEMVLFYHPAVWWVSRQVREQRERCCDEVAAEICGDRVAYARALADLEALRPLHGALALSAGGGSLPRRIRALLGVDDPPRFGRAGPLAAAVVAFGCLALLPAAARLSAAPEANQPANDKKVDEGPAEAPRDEDLVPASGDYRAGPGDILTVSISDLTGPGVETVKQTRINEAGTIGLPYIGQVRADGKTETELARDIAAAYRDAKLVENGNVSVTVSEGRQDQFSVMGDGIRPGVYRTGRGDYRLLDALVAAGAGNGVEEVLVIRRPRDNAVGRVIKIPGAALLAGEDKYNIVIRPRDVVRVKGTNVAVTRLIVRPDRPLMLDGHEMTWEQLPALLGKIEPARRATTALQLVPGSADMTLRQVAEARDRAEAVARQAGLKEVQVAYGAAGDGRVLKELPQADGSLQGTYYVGGNAVEHPGAYTISGRAVTLRQAVIAAGLPDGAAADIELTVIRKGDDRGEQVVRTGLAETLEAGNRNGSAPLRDGDQVLLRRRDK